jgi:hypothetical protein
MAAKAIPTGVPIEFVAIPLTAVVGTVEVALTELRLTKQFTVTLLAQVVVPF